MKKNWDNKEKAVVKILINTFTSVCFILPGVGLAETPTINTQAALTRDDLKALQDQQDQTRLCNDAKSKYDQAQVKIGEACKKAGHDQKTCLSQAKSCGEAAEESTFNTVDAFTPLLGIPQGTIGGLGKACPQYNGRDYFAEKDKILKEIKDNEKELAELNDDKAKLQDEYNKEMQELQEALTKAQEDLKKKNLELEQEDRERVAGFQQSQNEAKEQLRKTGLDLLRLRGELVKSQRNKAKAMAELTEETIRGACMAEVEKMKQSYATAPKKKNANIFRDTKEKNKAITNRYNTCLEKFNQAKMEVNEATQTEQERLNKEIANTQDKMDEIQNSLNLAASQLEEIKQATEKAKNDALQSVIDLGTLTQQKMQAAYVKLQENLKTLAAKTASLQAALNRANMSLMSLGPVPKRGAELTISEASSDIDAQVGILQNIANDDYIQTNCPGVAASAGSKVEEITGSRTKGSKVPGRNARGKQ